MSKIICPPQSGRVGPVVYVNGRYGQVVRQYVPPRNPQTPDQQRNRGNFGAVSRRWRGLVPEQRLAWRLAAADRLTVSRAGRSVPPSGYHYFVQVNAARAHLGLIWLDLPPVVPSFSPNRVAELAISNTGGTISLKLRVLAPPGQYTVVQGAAPVSAGVQRVVHYPFLGLLPAPVDGWSDITALYVARHGVPPVGSAVFIRTCQHVDGWTDLPRLTSAIVPPA
ncbi:MAG TPA: hypothetical protein PKI20_05740 [Verrucomicrobiota bacterium]|nr:hypothetical protein [Verrucomicrobiota bacterium]HQL77137.1 hypothetical protein [Verrucomicrobiota bacterium]